jgi:hypothetical protein
VGNGAATRSLVLLSLIAALDVLVTMFAPVAVADEKSRRDELVALNCLQPSLSVTHAGDQLLFVKRVANPTAQAIRFYGGMRLMAGPRVVLTEQGQARYQAWQDSLVSGGHSASCTVPWRNVGRVYTGWLMFDKPVRWDWYSHEIAPGQAIADTLVYSVRGDWYERFPATIEVEVQFVALDDSIPGALEFPEWANGRLFTVAVNLSADAGRQRAD